MQSALAKLEAPLDETGLAVVPLEGLGAGEYSFAAYLDQNGHGVLNRGKILGRPKEPVAFSKIGAPKLSRPEFKDAKVRVAPGDVVVITLEN